LGTLGHPNSNHGEAGHELPKWWKPLIEEIDKFVKDRPSGQCPVLLLRREPPPEAGPHYSTAAALVAGYQDRLLAGGAGVVPHSLVDDAELRKFAGERHVEILRRISRDFNRTMPEGSGSLVQRQFDLWSTVLDAKVKDGTPKTRRSALVEELHKELGGKRSWLRSLVESVTGILPASVAKVVTDNLDGLSRRWFAFQLNRKRNWRWVRENDFIAGRNFFDIAWEVTEGRPRRRNKVLIQKLLLTALVDDLSRAAKPSVWSPWRARRKWSFVLLLPETGEPGSPTDGNDKGESPCLEFLDTLNLVLSKGEACPILVLGSTPTGELPTYVKEIPGGENAGHELRKRYSHLPRVPTGRVWVVPLEQESDVGEAGTWLAVNDRIAPRENRAGDWVRPATPFAALAVAAAAVIYFFVGHAPHCWRAPNGEMVGVTDGNDGCDLATGPYADDVRLLEQVLKKNNRDAVTGETYRTLVFFAPMTATKSQGLATPTGIQLLKGALVEQAYLNSIRAKAKVGIRILIANAGEKFVYGSRNADNPSGPDVAKAIIARRDIDKIAAVFGITQSRYDSLAAINELNDAHIPVLGIGVTGDAMVGLSPPVVSGINTPGPADIKTPVKTPYKYFQLSPPDRRVATILADFAENSPTLRARVGPGKGKSPVPVVVVYDPDDGVFSADLAAQFADQFVANHHGIVFPVAYHESGGPSTRDVASLICDKVRGTGAFILNAARSGTMFDLLSHLRDNTDCHSHPGGITIVAESPAPELISEPSRLRPFGPLTMFYVEFSLPVKGDTFTQQFDQMFADKNAYADAAAGYDAVHVLSVSMNHVLASSVNADFSADDVFLDLNAAGISLPGESGLIKLDTAHRYPPEKGFYVKELTSDGQYSVELGCGFLQSSKTAARMWGPPGGPRFPCPSDK
jgi:hypothetical protein